LRSYCHKVTIIKRRGHLSVLVAIFTYEGLRHTPFNAFSTYTKQ